jgi:peptidoglycan/xylan/chitin deacetylase (PgdA/CDA1 family)
MQITSRRRLIASSFAAAAGSVASSWNRPGQSVVQHAEAQAAFDIVDGVPGCSRIALLFNVGASYEPATGILDTLSAYGVPATMFMMGWLAEQQPWIVQQIAAYGHVVGIHGYLPPELTTRSDDDVSSDLNAGMGAVTAALGYYPGPWFTPYAGASDDRVRSIASSLGLVTVGWGIDSMDWQPWVAAGDIYWQVVNGAYDGAIVELHYDAQQSVNGTAVALPWIIEDLSAQGYSFVTVPQIAGDC